MRKEVSREILGQSTAVKEMVSMINRVAGTKTGVLIIGESGTGKELVARMIHTAGPLKDKPFVPVNCGAIPETLIESELFGHRRGSFTGAVADKPGLFEAANGGTIFLDEVGELPLSMQVKLLRVIQERNFRKVGGTDDIKVDVRIIAATNRDLEAAVAKGTFREDLYYRLNVILIKTPSLRERKGDVRLLSEAFLKRASERHKKPLSGFAPDAMAALEAYTWPGNIRELENVIERAVTLESGASVSLGSFPAGLIEAVAARLRSSASESASRKGSEPAGGAPGPRTITLPAPDFSRGPIDLDAILGEAEKSYLQAALAHAGGKKKKAAELLGITFRSIRYRLSKAGVESEGED
jgi:two-component system response regulator PilR (NtrC family)